MTDTAKISSLPLLALKNSVLFPGLMMPLSVGRASSVSAVEAAAASEGKEIVVVAQRDALVDSPGASDLFTIGTRAVIRKVSRPKEDHMDVLVLGRHNLYKQDQKRTVGAGERARHLSQFQLD